MSHQNAPWSGWDFHMLGELRGPTASSTAAAAAVATEQQCTDDPSSSTSDNNKNDEFHKDGQQQNCTRTSTFWNQCRAFKTLSLPYFEESTRGRNLFLVLIVLMLLNSAVRVFFSYLARDFWSALSNKQVDEFWDIIRKFIFAMLFLAPINVFYRFQRQRLGIYWREWMTRRVLEMYYANRVYYRLERNLASGGGGGSSVDTDSTAWNDYFWGRRERKGVDPSSSRSDCIDNPDQRICQDVNSFTQYSLSFFLTIAVSFIDLVCFSAILYTIEPSLFLSIIAFALVGTVATVIIGKSLVRLNFEQLLREADFRYSLVRFRENAESIAFFAGESSEGQHIQSRFDRVLKNFKAIIGTQRNLDFFTSLYSYVIQFLPIVVIAPDYFAGEVELGVIQQAAVAFGHVLDDLSLIINEFDSLTAFSASITRLHSFVLAIQEADPYRDPTTSPLTVRKLSQRNCVGEKSTMEHKHQEDGGYTEFSSEKFQDEEEGPTISKLSGVPTQSTSMIRLIQHSSPRRSTLLESTQADYGSTVGVALALRDLTLSTPGGSRTLLRNLNLSLQWGQNLLVVGPSGVGKSSLLRAIAGLWVSGRGTIERPSSDEMYFLPQRPYCPLGTLRDQLLYPVIRCNEKLHGSSNGNGDDAKHNNTNIYDSIHYTPTPFTSPSVFWTEEKLQEVLSQVGLADLSQRVGGLDAVLDWSNTLSLGEQQRLAFGRVLIHRPKLVVLDESTSACDVAGEKQLYALLRQQPQTQQNQGSANITVNSGGSACCTSYISVGHRPTLLEHHDMRLNLQGLDTHCLDKI